MKFQLKKVKVFHEMSEETTAFVAEIWANGKFLADIKNDGRGGSTDINNYNEGGRDLLRKAFEYCKTLPKQIFPAAQGFPETAHDMSLDLMIDILLDDYMFLDNLKKHFNKGIVYGEMQGEVTVYGSGTSIAKLKKTKEGQAKIRKYIKEAKGDLKKGEQIFNTNLKGYL